MAADSPGKPVSVDDRHKALEVMAAERFGDLTPGEQKLLRGVVEGAMADLSPGAKAPPEPEAAKPEQQVRARLLRWLLTDREAQALFEKSEVWLSGALIEDDLDLEYADIPVAILFSKCQIMKPIVLRQAWTRTLSLGGCQTAGIAGDGVHIQGACLLRYGFVADGEVRLLSARIEVIFDCTRGTFRNPAIADEDGTTTGGTALHLDGAIVNGDVFLNDGFKSVGEVRLLGAKIAGDISCRRGSFRNSAGNSFRMERAAVDGGVFLTDGFTSEGEVRLLGAKIGGDLVCQDCKLSNRDGRALTADGTHVEGALFLRSVEIEGTVDLTSMSVRTLVDEAEAWPQRIHLNNFHYDEIFGGSPLDARSRIQWLTRQPPPRDLDPQPWRHLAAVLRKQGHESDARKVMLHNWWRRMLLEPQRFADAREHRNALKSCLLLLPRMLYWLVVGYGYARWRALPWLIAFWLLGTLIFAFEDGANMKEAHPYAMRSRVVIDELRPDEDVPPEHRWIQSTYPALNPWVYSLDTLLPIVDFHQETYWTPKDGPVRWLYLPLHIIMGWVVTSLFVVSFTGLVRRGDE